PATSFDCPTTSFGSLATIGTRWFKHTVTKYAPALRNHNHANEWNACDANQNYISRMEYIKQTVSVSKFFYIQSRLSKWQAKKAKKTSCRGFLGNCQRWEKITEPNTITWMLL
ncbi:MAG: hypothetical protein LBB36_06415, partial [Fibromonadaceae bacterium]|nr:hypothetical protein [Fibromonadaceae bacterium]